MENTDSNRNNESESVIADKPNSPPVDRKRLLTDEELPRKKTKLDAEDCDDYPITEFGIDAFVVEGSALDLIVRHRYSDFVVNEIDCDGNIVRLTDFSVPEMPRNESVTEFPEIDLQLQDQVRQEAQAVLSGSSAIASLCLDGKDKKERTAVHNLIRHISDKLISRTITTEGHCKIEIVKQGGGSSGRNSKRQDTWSKEKPQYTICVLYKENLDTASAVYKIARTLRIGSVGRFSYAGMKDKRGKTTQLLSCYRVLPSELIKINSRCHSIKVGNFRLSDNGIKLGQLKGNRFAIALRGVKDYMQEEIRKRVDDLGRLGFINYFGRQRFGCHVTSTDRIGLLILKREWKQAVQAILDPAAARDESLQMALLSYRQSGNAAKAMTFTANGTHTDCNELRLLDSLASSQTDYLGALSKIPRNLRTLYLHAYQSKIWNRLASFRLRKYGLSVKAGDLIQGKDGDIYIASEDDCADVYDLVLPIIGSNTKYPSNAVLDEINRIFEEDGVDKSIFNSVNKDYCLNGDYRRWLIRPTDLAVEFKRYNELDEHETDPTADDNTDEKAVVLQFTLPPSSYATMALREIIKKDTETKYN